MTAARPLARTSLVDELAADLRGRILDGDLPAGAPLRELELSRSYDVSRHTLRSALRALAADGLVDLAPNRGASVAALDDARLVGLWELRTALEAEAARLALERDPDGFRAAVEDAVGRLAAVCARRRPAWSAVADAHAAVHQAIVDAAGSGRIAAAYATLAGELRLFLVQLRPVWGLDRMASHHQELAAGLAAGDVEVLRRHLRDGADALRGTSGTE